MAPSINDRYIGQLIRSAIDAGNSHFMLVKDRRGWQCSVKRPDGHSFHVIVDADPIEAVYRCVVPWNRQDHTSQPPHDPNAGSPFRDLEPKHSPHDLFRPYNPSEAKG